jgi:hypothetical protein
MTGWFGGGVPALPKPKKVKGRIFPICEAGQCEASAQYKLTACMGAEEPVPMVLCKDHHDAIYDKHLDQSEKLLGEDSPA